MVCIRQRASMLLLLPALLLAGTAQGDAVDDYGVVWTSPSVNELGAMPVGNGRASANVFVEAGSCDLVLTLGLADALDENSNLLKLGRVRVRAQPSFCGAGNFTQSLVLSTGTVEVRSDGGAAASVFVDAATSAVRVSLAPPADSGEGNDGSSGSGSGTLSVVAALENWRLGKTVDVSLFGNGWAGAGGSFCNASDGSFAQRVYTYPDTLDDGSAAATGIASVAWHHRNDAARADYYGQTMREQGLGSLIGTDAAWDPLTNRTWGAALSGVDGFSLANGHMMDLTATDPNPMHELQAGHQQGQS